MVKRRIGMCPMFLALLIPVLLVGMSGGCGSKSKSKSGGAGGNETGLPSTDISSVGDGLNFKLMLVKHQGQLKGGRFTVRVPKGWELLEGRQRVSWNTSGPDGIGYNANLEVQTRDKHPKNLAWVKKIHDPTEWKGKVVRAEAVGQTDYIHTSKGPTGAGAAHGRKETQVTTTLYRKLPSGRGFRCSASYSRSPKVKSIKAAQRLVETLCLTLTITPVAVPPRPKPPKSPSADVAVPKALVTPAVRCKISAKRMTELDWAKAATAPEHRTIHLGLLFERCMGFPAFAQASFNIVLKNHGIKHVPVPKATIPTSFRDFWEKLCPGALKAFGAPSNKAETHAAHGRLFDRCRLGQYKLVTRKEFTEAQYPGVLVFAVYWSLRRGGMQERHARGFSRILLK